MPSAGHLVDTDILSELLRPRPNAGVLSWADSVQVVALSTVSVEEIALGLAWRPHPRIQVWFDRLLAEYCELLDITPAIARRAGALRGELRGEGKVRTQADMLIAATAQVHGLTLVTRNTRDFAGCRVPLLDPSK